MSVPAKLNITMEVLDEDGNLWMESSKQPGFDVFKEFELGVERHDTPEDASRKLSVALRKAADDIRKLADRADELARRRESSMN